VSPPPADTTVCLGRVAAPPEHECTSSTFYFWVDQACTVERTQIVTTSCLLAGRTVNFVGIVQEVYRRSRQKDIGEEAARFDSRSGVRPPFDSEGVTYAEVAILRTDPVAHTPPTEESEVYLASAADAAKGFGVDKMKDKLDIGLLRNGGTQFAGRACIDLAFLLGENGGHLNVNGIAGLGTKSTLLLSMNWLLLREAARQKKDHPSGRNPLQVVPVIFNVKNFDLFFIDRWNTSFKGVNNAEHLKNWRDLGVDDPAPFKNPKFLAPQSKTTELPVGVGGRDANTVTAYSWSLADVIRQGLFKFLFSEDEIGTANLGGLVGEVEEWLTSGTSDDPKLRTTDGAPKTFQELLDWFKENKKDKEFFGDFLAGTKGSFYRRLKYVVMEGEGVLRRKEAQGKPLLIPNCGQDSPTVIDLYGLVATPSLQRFVVAAVFDQIQKTQSKAQVKNLKFLITLDELNRFAPRDGHDPITQKLETVASEGRSQGIILFGAQQQASLVKPRVIENSAVRAIGRSGTLELGAEVWKFLGPSARSAASQLQPDEKLIYQPSFREPMLAKIPFPPFALSENDAAPAEPSGGGATGKTSGYNTAETNEF
jgi:DNA helicase HerA-like ATPase